MNYFQSLQQEQAATEPFDFNKSTQPMDPNIDFNALLQGLNGGLKSTSFPSQSVVEDLEVSLKSKYNLACQIPSDINEHVATLKELAQQSSSVAEFGVRGGVSTYGLLYGLAQSSQQGTKSYVGVDINPCPITTEMQGLAEGNGIVYQFIQNDSAKVDIPQVDLLFIDSWHIYGHLKRELAQNHTKVNKFIAMHDTIVDGEYGETLRVGWNAEEQSKTSGYPVEDICKGLQYAIDEFLASHPEWKLQRAYQNNNGLTILARV